MSEYIVDFGSLAMLSRVIESEGNRLGEPVVRCRDCKYRYGCVHLVDNGDDDMRCCHATPDGFCSWGKPRGEGDTDET